jgi:hypothetical protein
MDVGKIYVIEKVFLNSITGRGGAKPTRGEAGRGCFFKKSTGDRGARGEIVTGRGGAGEEFFKVFFMCMKY